MDTRETTRETRRGRSPADRSLLGRLGSFTVRRRWWVIGAWVVLLAVMGSFASGLTDRLCRKIAFSRQNPKIVYWKINDLRVQTFLFSVICDRAHLCPHVPHALRLCHCL
jgi:predicted NAD-dependent protein-ADP-ribosyltransferase YbiA (DUF1768 family)